MPSLVEISKSNHPPPTTPPPHHTPEQSAVFKFNEILIETQTFHFMKTLFKMSSAKWRPFCLVPNVLTLLIYRRQNNKKISWYINISHNNHVRVFVSWQAAFAVTSELTHWGRDKMAAIFQTTFSNAFSWIKMFEFRLNFHWNLFPRVQLTIFQQWFR